MSPDKIVVTRSYIERVVEYRAIEQIGVMYKYDIEICSFYILLCIFGDWLVKN